MSDDHLPRSVVWGLRSLGEGTAAVRHLRDCAECAAKLRGAETRIAEIVARAVEATPPLNLRDRVLASSTKAPRLVRFADVVARMLDVSHERALECLAAVDEPSQWEETPFDGVKRMPIEGGPRTRGAVTHFVRVEPGKIVPMHEHLGPEVGIFLQGRGRGPTGKLCGPGDIDEYAIGTAHSVEGLPSVTSVMLVVAHGGVRFDNDFLLLPKR